MRWEAFFGEDNVAELQWKALSEPTNPARKALQRFIDLVERRAPIAALPRARKSLDRVEWYVGWRSESDARFASDLLAAFLGRTYAEMSTPIRRLVPADAAEQAFVDEFDGRAFRVEVHPQFRKKARERLEVLAKCLLERPHRRASKVRPVGRILRDIEFAIQQGDDTLVAEEIRALREGGHLDEVNLAFLELRRLGAKNDWDGVLADDSLTSVLDLHALPWRVRKVILDALYHRHLAAPVGEGAVEKTLACFEHLLANFGAALSSRKNLFGLEADVCFLLADEVRGQATLETAEAVLTRIAGFGEVAFADAFRALLAARRRAADTSATISAVAPAAPEPSSAVDLAQRALVDGDLDRAFSAALAAPPSLQRVKVLLQCARLLDDEVASADALVAWEQLTQQDRDALLKYGWCRGCVDYVRTATGTARTSAEPPPATPPTASWLAWFERLRLTTEWPGAVSRAEKGVAEWNAESIAGDPGAITTVVEVIEGTLDDWAAEALRQGLPYILEAFLDDPPDPRLSPVFGSLFDVLATDDALTLSSISALVRLAQARLSTAPLAYRATLDVIAGAVEQADTPGTVRSVADALEMLVMTPCASNDERTAIATRLASVAARRWRRVDEIYQDLIRQLCGELGVAGLLPTLTDTSSADVEAESEWAALAGKYVAFYSLEHDALQRVVKVLRRACPEAKLKTFSELGGTDPMREAARTAELFVIATKSATHAATGAIMQHRRGGKATEYARSKSSTSLLEAVRRWLDRERGN